MAEIIVPKDNKFEKGDSLTFRVTFKDAAGALADPTEVTARLLPPTPEVAIVEIYNGGAGNVIRDSIGEYSITQTLGQFEGIWSQRFEGTGTVQVSIEQVFLTNNSAF